MRGWRVAMTAAAGVMACACNPDRPATEAAETTPPAVAATPPAAPADPSSPAPAPTAAQPTGGSGQNFSFDSTGELQIVGPRNQYNIVLPTDVLFDFDKDQLRPDAGPLLAKLKAHFATHDADQLHVIGHTDAKGDDVYNFKLSQRRALAVCQWLKANTDESFTNCIGKGEGEPVAPNTAPGGADDPVGRQKNRRVNIAVIAYPDVNAMMNKAQGQADAALATLPR